VVAQIGALPKIGSTLARAFFFFFFFFFFFRSRDAKKNVVVLADFSRRGSRLRPGEPEVAPRVLHMLSALDRGTARGSLWLSSDAVDLPCAATGERVRFGSRARICPW